MKIFLIGLLMAPLGAQTTESYKGKTPQGDDCSVNVELVDPVIHKDFTRKISVRNDTKNVTISPIVVRELEAPSYTNPEGHPTRGDSHDFSGYRYVGDNDGGIQSVIIVEAKGSTTALNSALVQSTYRGGFPPKIVNFEIDCRDLVAR